MKVYAPKINLYFLNKMGTHEVKELSNMIRGLRNCHEGFSAVSGLSDFTFLKAYRNKSKISLLFKNTQKAFSFKTCIDKYFPTQLRARRVVYKRPLH